MKRFYRVFRDGYSLSERRAAELERKWKNFQARCRRQGKRAQLNYHGVGEFSFSSFPRLGRDS